MITILTVLIELLTALVTGIMVFKEIKNPSPKTIIVAQHVMAAPSQNEPLISQKLFDHSQPKQKGSVSDNDMEEALLLIGGTIAILVVSIWFYCRYAYTLKLILALACAVASSIFLFYQQYHTVEHKAGLRYVFFLAQPAVFDVTSLMLNKVLNFDKILLLFQEAALGENSLAAVFSVFTSIIFEERAIEIGFYMLAQIAFVGLMLVAVLAFINTIYVLFGQLWHFKWQRKIAKYTWLLFLPSMCIAFNLLYMALIFLQDAAQK